MLDLKIFLEKFTPPPPLSDDAKGLKTLIPGQLELVTGPNACRPLHRLRRSRQCCHRVQCEGREQPVNIIKKSLGKTQKRVQI
jgi:hypothetical protein